MDYKVTPAQMNQTTGKQVSNEGERKQPVRIKTQKSKEASEATETTEDVDEDVYYDSDGGRYTRRTIRQERKEVRENRREKRRGGDRPVRKIR